MVDFLSSIFGFNLVFNFIFTDTTSDFRYYLIKPWSRTGFSHSIKWPHPYLMTPQAKKQTPFIHFVY